MKIDFFGKEYVLERLNPFTVKITSSKFGSHIGSVTKNIVFYLLVLSTIFAFLGVFEVNLTGVVAAAGILGIIIGFCPQESGHLITAILDSPTLRLQTQRL